MCTRLTCNCLIASRYELNVRNIRTFVTRVYVFYGNSMEGFVVYSGGQCKSFRGYTLIAVSIYISC